MAAWTVKQEPIQLSVNARIAGANYVSRANVNFPIRGKVKILYGWEKTALVLTDKDIEDIIDGKLVTSDGDRILLIVRRETPEEKEA
jgi:hypothetical protein